MLNKKLTTCSPILLQDLEDDDDDDEFEVRRSSSPVGGLFLHKDVVFSKRDASDSNLKKLSESSGGGSPWGGGGPPLNFSGGAGPSSTVNNAITVAPSRNHHQHDPNVFTGGRPPKKHKRHKGHHHHRSKSPGGHPQGGNEGSILTRIDHSIMSNFGDWSTVEDDPPHKPVLVATKSRSNHRPYYLPAKVPSTDLVTSDPTPGSSDALPKLFKPYEVVVTSPTKKLNAVGVGVAGTSKDNADPHSILSEAKRTLNAYGVHLTVD